MYHPNLGRFNQLDPIGFDAGDRNLYRNEGNNPVSATDPSGTSVILPPLALYYHKEIVREEWRWFSSAIEWKGYDFTAYLLRHSLQDNPPNITIDLKHPGVAKIRASQEFQSTIKDVGKNAKSGIIPENVKGIAFISGDLFVGVHNADFHYKGCKKDDDNYELEVWISDVYDFDVQTQKGLNSLFSGQFFKAAGWAVNDIAALNQKSGWIVPYQWETEKLHVKVVDGKIEE